MTDEAAPPDHVAKMSWPRRIARIVERALAIVGAIFIVYHAFFEITEVVTPSMSPLLRGPEVDGNPDCGLIEKLSAGTPPRRFQVVAFMNHEGLKIAKRCVGLPGDVIAIVSHSLVVNGEKLPTPDGVGRGKGYLAAGNLHDGQPFTVPEGHVYLLGDDQQDSEDGRFTGPLPLAKVRGRVILRCWPLKRLKWLL